MTVNKFANLSFWAWLLIPFVHLAYTVTTGEESLILRLIPVMAFWGMLSPLFYDWLRQRSEVSDKALFLLELADMLRLEVPTSEAVSQMSLQRSKSFGHRFTDFRKAISAVSLELEKGESLQSAFQKTRGIPGHWGPVLQGIETPDQMASSLEELAAIESSRIRFPILSGLRLMIMVPLLLGIFFFLAEYIFPTFVELFIGMDIALPLPSQVLVSMSSSNPILRLCLTIFGLLMTLLALSIPFKRIRNWLLSIGFYIPGLKTLVSLEQQSRALKSLATATRSKLPLQDSLTQASRAVYVRAYRKGLQKMAADQGSKLSQLLSQYPGLFRKDFVWLVQQGEAFEDLAPSLSAASDAAKEELGRATQRFVNYTDTLVIILIGAVVAIGAIGILLPISILTTWGLP